MKMDHPLPLQFGAIPYRRDGDTLEVLLVTSRETCRWILPKGWPMKSLKPHEAAEREALEEAGVVGRIGRKAVGEYAYFKRMSAHFVLCSVRLYLLEVTGQAKHWKEEGQRQLGWFTPAQASERVDEPELAAILKTLPSLIEKPA